MRVDLHMHTRASDGLCSAEQLLAEVQRRRLVAWAITDHDSLRGWRQIAPQPGLIPGVEFTAGLHGREIHIVGLGIDPEHDQLNQLLTQIQSLRRFRIDRILDHVNRQRGLNLYWAQVDDGETECPSRLHLARHLRQMGQYQRTHAAFIDLLSDAAIQGLDLPDFPSMRQVAEIVRAAGGVTILAHPGIYRQFERIQALMDSGQLDGLEVNHPRLEPRLRQALELHAKHCDLLRSCGSDFHQPGRRQIGDWRLSRAMVMPLLSRIGWQPGLAPKRQAG